jgi:hypothetical protein
MLVAALGAIAVAQEPTFEGLGQAPVVAGDRARARERALDEAMRQAVEQAVGTVLTPDELVARSSDLKLRFYPRARSYVTTYRVLDEGEPQPGTFQVHLQAQVATARLQRELQSPTPSVGLPRLPVKLRAIVCAQSASSEIAATAAKQVRDVLAARNVEAIAPPDGCTDESAAQAAKTSGSQGAVIAIVDAQEAGEIRGTEKHGGHARAKLHLVEPEGRVSAEGSAERDAYDATADRAAARAAREAVDEAALKLQPSLAQKWAPVAPQSGVLVKVTGAGRWADLQAVTRALQSLPGVALVEPRHFSRGVAELLVKTASAAGQLAGGLSRMPPQGVHVNVRATGDGSLTIDITGSDADVIPSRG